MNINKVTNAILYMLDNKVTKLDDKKLSILLFLIDYNHQKNCGNKIFDETYIKSARNPKAQGLSNIFDVIINDEDLSEEDERLYIIQEFLNYLDIEIIKQNKFTQLKFIKMEEEYDKDLFSQDELKTINKIIKLYKNESIRKLANICFSIDIVRQTQKDDVII